MKITIHIQGNRDDPAFISCRKIKKKFDKFLEDLYKDTEKYIKDTPEIETEVDHFFISVEEV